MLALRLWQPVLFQFFLLEALRRQKRFGGCVQADLKQGNSTNLLLLPRALKMPFNFGFLFLI
ncbi:hypothetical protein Hanom_Chr02g00155211 [Helianthus anomalus]